jgi:prepilin-type processing-associated H-X9-DG protein
MSPARTNPRPRQHPRARVEHATTRPDRLTAFTLVELLILIGIVAILISLLMPALAKARRSAIALQCASNMRQVGIGFSMYAAENKHTLPYALYQTTTPDVRIAWDDLLNKYLGGDLTSTEIAARYAPRPRAVLQCPADAVPRAWTVPNHPLSYAMPRVLIATAAPGEPLFAGVAGDGVFPNPTAAATSPRPISIRVSSVRRSSQTLLLVEAPNRYRAQGCDYGYVDRPDDQYPFYTSNYNGYPSNASGPAAHPPSYTLHDGKWNYLFTDGHVEFLRPSETLGHSTTASTDDPQGPWTRDPND